MFYRLNSLVIPQQETWVRIVDPNLIKQTIIARNQEHSHQATKTPFGRQDVQQVTGWHGNSNECEQPRQGYIHPTIQEATKFHSAEALFQQLSNKNDLP